MKARKITLLASIAILAAVAVAQAVLAGGNGVKTLALAAKPDSIEIAKAGGAPLLLVKSGDRWIAGEEKYPVAGATVDAMLAALESVRVLGDVSGSADYARYGLDDASRLTVTVSAGGKVIRTIVAGKNVATGQQSYALIDSGSSVRMVSGSLRDTFDKKLEDVRDRNVWTVPAAGISRVEVNPSETGTFAWAIAKAGDPPVWTLVPGSAAAKENPDAALAADWAESLANLRADGFAPAGTAVPSSSLGGVRITAAGKTISLTIAAKEVDGRYLCVSSEIPYPFYLSAQ